MMAPLLSRLEYTRGTAVHCALWRLLGARIGAGVVLDTCRLDAPDLVSIGDGAMVGHNAELLGHRFLPGVLVLDTVRVGARA